MPRGRFWMNRMMNTRIAILAQHRAGKGLKEFIGDAERERADQRAPQVSDAAEHHDHERVDDVALPQVGRDVVDLRERNAGQAGNAGAEAEGERVDARGADADGGSHARFCVTARISRPSRVKRSMASSATKTMAVNRMIHMRL